MFSKNLELINNEALKRRLVKISLIESRQGISYCVTPTNDYVLLKDDIPTDDLQNPREAVRTILKNNIKYEMNTNDVIINFGIGLGYLLDESFNNYPSKYVSTTIEGINPQMPTTLTYTIEDEIILPNPTGDVSFLGWYLTSDCEGTPIVALPKGSYGNVVLYAKWDK